MYPEVKAEWLAKLRDGRPQTTGRLQDHKGQCCLGVLCELAAEKGIIQPAEFKYSGEVAFFGWRDVEGFYHEEDTVLPEAVAEWAGLDDSSPTVEVDPGFEHDEWGDIIESDPSYIAFTEKFGHEPPDSSSYLELTDINDSGWTFTQIADLIEQYL